MTPNQDKFLKVRISKELRIKVERAAKFEGRTIPDWTRRALEHTANESIATNTPLPHQVAQANEILKRRANGEDVSGLEVANARNVIARAQI